MANLKEIDLRKKSVQSTMQVTSAMQVVSSTKLKKAQSVIMQLRPYAEGLEGMMSNIISAAGDNAANDLAQPGRGDKRLAIVFTSNRGLCGVFNTSIIKRAKSYAEERDTSFITLGSKGNMILSKTHDVAEDHSQTLNHLTFADMASIAEHIITLFRSGEYSGVDIIYTKFVSAGTQQVCVEPFLPIDLNSVASEEQSVEQDYIFEPTPTDILDVLIPKALNTQLYRCAADSIASEHSARMVAMKKATENAKDLAAELTLTFNKLRQAAITKEILEIVAGAEAV